jgi:hypothetical protein
MRAITSGPTARAVQAAQTTGDWSVVKEWSGESGLVETERFTTTARTFRVSWKATELEFGGILDIFVRTDDRRLLVVAAGLQDHVKKSASGTINVNSAPGPHYLEIRGTGVRWQVAVEQPKG